LTLPVLLMINNGPLFYLPAICWQLLFFRNDRLDSLV
ncbi:MAG: hypothetical protein ACJAUZ_000123, partial [Flavobacteriaceae bacterium]